MQAISVQAYDQHLNMILGEVEETITTIEIDDETYEEIIKVDSLLHMALDCMPKCLLTISIWLMRCVSPHIGLSDQLRCRHSLSL